MSARAQEHCTSDRKPILYGDYSLKVTLEGFMTRDGTFISPGEQARIISEYRGALMTEGLSIEAIEQDIGNKGYPSDLFAWALYFAGCDVEYEKPGLARKLKDAHREARRNARG